MRQLKKPAQTTPDDPAADAGAMDALRRIKILHTAVWAFFAACILAIPVAATLGALRPALVLIGIVAFEVVVLVANRFTCPLTHVAARYTPDRHDNFDIYLPLWLARHNQLIFGTLYAAGIVYTLVMWRVARVGH
jgi:hypothetical protein